MHDNAQALKESWHAGWKWLLVFRMLVANPKTRVRTRLPSAYIRENMEEHKLTVTICRGSIEAETRGHRLEAMLGVEK